MGSTSRGVKELSKLLTEGDSAAIELARGVGLKGLSTVGAQLEHADGEVRFLAIECLVAIGGAEVSRLLLAAVEDSSAEVRLEAVNSLLTLDPVAELAPELSALFDRVPNGFLRRQLALVLGRLDPKASRSRLGRHLVDVDLARDGLLAASARQGDPVARRRLKELLAVAVGDRVAVLIGLFRYVDRVEHAVDLLPVLEREDVVQDLSTHRRQLLRRACDLALDEFLRLRPGELTFGVRPLHEPYSYTELLEARTVLRGEAEAGSD